MWRLLGAIAIAHTMFETQKNGIFEPGKTNKQLHWNSTVDQLWPVFGFTVYSFFSSWHASTTTEHT